MSAPGQGRRCVEKIAFRSVAAARKQLRLIRSSTRPEFLGQCERAYYECPICGLWHLTSQEQR